MNKVYVLISILILFSNCASVEKYNAQIAKLHTPELIHEDIDEANKILNRLHPRLHWFISKDSLDNSFNQLKKSIDKPLSSQEFYMKLAPVIAKIRQGHTSVSPPYKKQLKSEIKDKGKRSSPFKHIQFTGINNKVYIKKVFKKADTTLLVGSEVLAVDNEPTEKLINSYKKLVASDGYNTTFSPRVTAYAFGSFYQKTHKRSDTIKLTLKYKDSLYTHFLFASYSKKEKEKLKENATEKKKEKTKKLTKVQRKAKKKWEKKVGYNKYRDDQTRTFKFLKKDSITVAFIKIKKFKNGNSEVFYEEAFEKIDSAKVKHLIIDLRDNFGGSLAQVADLYSYLTDKNHVLLEDFEMTNRFSYMGAVRYSTNSFIKTLGIVLAPFYNLYFQIFTVKSRGGKHYMRLKFSKEQEPKDTNYKGALYIITNGNSFSASSTLSTHLHATKRATFIGEETGGTYNASIAGLFVYKELPNSKVNMRFGVNAIKTPYTGKPDGYGIKPDVYIPTTTLEKDEQLDWILEHLIK